MNTARLAWHHLIFDIPDTWEVVRYKNNYRDGMLGLMDRYGDAMQVFWRVMKPKADVPRRLADLVIELGGTLEEHEVRRMITRRHGWSVFTPKNDRVPVLAARVQKHGPAPGHPADARIIERNYGENALIYCVFPPGNDRKVIDRVLESYKPNYDEQHREWAAFGLQIDLPAEMTLDRLHIFPTSQVFRFEDRDGQGVTFQRYAMLDAIIGQDTPDVFYARMKGKATQMTREDTFRKDGRHDGLVLTYHTRGRGGITAMTAPRWQGRVWVWTCPDLQRLYVVDGHSRLENAIADLPDRVVCRGGGTLPEEGAVDVSQVRSAREIIDQQLRSVPALNPYATTGTSEAGNVTVTAPRKPRWWQAPIKGILGVSNLQVTELDPVGSEVVRLIDGERPMEDIINAHQRRWKLSFQEARMMILEYLRRLMKKRLVYVMTPDDEEDGTA